MDDQLEGEVLCEVFWAHVHLLGRYLAVTSAGLVDMVTPGPGETFKGKMLQPGPFLFIVFLAIVGSVALQNSGHLVWEWLARTHRVLGLHRVADTTLRSLDLSGACAPSGSEVWELQDGPVGVYGLQGRRATMEDRYCVIQDVDVGSKTLSFLGVFDGHGGQYTAEFVKDNLFQNTISKIKQLRTQTSTAGTCNASSSNNGSCKTQSNNRTRNCNANSKGEKRWLSGEDDSKETKDAKESCPANNNNNNNKLKVPNTLAAKPGGIEGQDAQEKASSTTTTDSKLATGAPEVTGGGSCVENLNSITSATQASTTTTTTMSCSTASSTCSTTSSSSSSSSSISHCTESNTESLKKDDTYSSVNIRRTSLASTASKDKKEEVAGTGSGCGAGNGIQNDSCYIDVLQNINYTRLLTDQILAVDRQVVAHCKARTDMSGSTAVVAVLDGEMLVIGNVGDSRAVMADLKGSTIPLSFDHKPNQSLGTDIQFETTHLQFESQIDVCEPVFIKVEK
ncbi:Protein phosphatase 1L [Portunus trituberculatus]|uniref:Protein phosphatase 1L n=1 Tax=Portunus trituberculatus TaxID=210409 RepID=A0A5B7CDS4_PORTR|nr:Protein phosphatase 1L [Portunus trituberculatus]